ncbi:MAG: hypothetical protein ACXW6J_27720 [Candidatus Binatia bacterium]
MFVPGIVLLAIGVAHATYLFGAVCPEQGKGSGLVLPVCNAEAMQIHLDDIAAKIAPRAHATLVFDHAGCHDTKSLKTPRAASRS